MSRSRFHQISLFGKSSEWFKTGREVIFAHMKKPDPPITGTAHRIPKPGDADPRLRAARAFRRNLSIAAAAGILVVLCLLFPRVLGFVELASREIRYLWWLILIVALGIWLAFFFGKKRD